MNDGPTNGPSDPADARQPQAIDAAPIVPAALVPAVEQPAFRPRAPLWQSFSVFVLVVALLALAGWGGVLANDRWGTRAMTLKAIAGIEALIKGDADTLASLSTASVGKELTPMVRAKMRLEGLPATFAAPVWVGDTATIAATVGVNKGRLNAAPQPSGAPGIVVFQTQGALSTTAGAVRLERTWSGWVITALSVQAVPTSGTALPPGHP